MTKSLLQRIATAVAMLLLVGTLALVAAPPAWWTANDTRIIEDGGTANNYAPANLGQLKFVAKQAKAHLDAQLPGGAGSAVSDKVATFEPRAGQNYTQEQIDAFKAANYAPINLGQLKAVAKPFYDRLLAAGYNTKQNLIAHGYPSNWAYDYPWNPDTPKAANYAPANLGQLKAVFSFDAVGLYDSSASTPLLNIGVISAWIGVPLSQHLSFSNSPSSVTVDGLSPGLTFNSSTMKLEGMPTAAGIFNTTFEATNSYGSATSVLTIAISGDLPDAPIINSALVDQATVGAQYAYRIAAENTPISYNVSALPAGLSLDVGTGIISGIPTQSGTFPITISAQNPGGVDTNVMVLTINPAAALVPVITSPGTAAGIIGTPFTYTITANNSPTSFAVDGLPNGLTFNSAAGIISGVVTSIDTAAASITVPIVVQAIGIGGTASQAVYLTINNGESTITSPLTVHTGVGDNFFYQIQASNSPMAYLAGSLPSWLTFDPNTGDLFGSPPATVSPQTLPYQVVVQLGVANLVDPNPAMVDLTIVVGNPPPMITSAVTANGSVQTPFTYQITATETPTSFTAQGLPDGLTLNATSGLISGTPTTAGDFTVILTAANADGEGDSLYIDLVIAPLGIPVITSPTKIYVTQGQPVSYVIEASGLPTAFSTNDLPAGLSFDAVTHSITGSIADVGTPEITLSATNAEGIGTNILRIIVLSSSQTVNAVLTLADSHSPTIEYRTTSVGISKNPSDPTVADEPSPGTDGIVGAEAAPGPVYHRTLLGFGLTDLPADAVITSTDFSLDGYAWWAHAELANVGLITVEVYRAGAFDPKTATWNDNSAHGSALLSSLTGNFFGSVPQLIDNPPDPRFIWHSSSAFVSAVQDAVDTAQPIYLMLMSAESESAAQNTLPKEAVLEMERNPDHHTGQPFMTISYTTAAPPEILSPIHYNPEIVVHGARIYEGVKGRAFNYWINALHAPTEYGATGLPEGLSLDASTGNIHGYPTVEGTFDIILSATNANGTGTEHVVLTVDAPAPQITSSLTASVAAKSPFSYTIAGTNNPTSFNASNLPNGLTINQATGVISGTVTNPGIYNIGIVATDAGGSTSATLVLTVQPIMPVITGPATASGNVGVSILYSYIYVQANNSPSSYAATNLPPGLQIDSQYGYISGTPTQVGTCTAHLSATNSGGTGTADLIFTIGPAPLPVVTQATLQATLGVSTSLYVQATNYPTSYQASGLPPGLSMTTYGYISGTPTQTGDFPVSITAVNQYGSGTGTVQIVVGDGRVSFSGSSSIDTFVGQYVSYTNYTINYASATIAATGLPPGLQFSPFGIGFTIYGTPAQAGTYTVTVTATNSQGSLDFPLTITVFPTLAITSSGVVTGQMGVPLTFSLAANTDQPAWQITGLPAGLTFDGTNNVISGTPAVSGQTVSHVTLTKDGVSVQGSLIFNISAPSTNLVSEFQEHVNPTVLYEVPSATIASDTQDTTIASSGEASQEIGWVGRTPATTVKRILLAFDLSSISDTATLTTAKLDFHVPDGNFGPSPLDLRLYKVAVPFDEVSPSWMADSSYENAELGRMIVSGSGPQSLYGSASLVQAISDARASGGDTLYLMLLAPAAESSLNLSAFAGIITHGEDPIQNPKLTVYYTDSAPSQAPTITSPAEVTVTVGQPMNYRITATNRPTAFAATDLPAGLTTDSATGVISGTPNQVGEFSVNLSATNWIGTGAAVLALRVDSVIRADALTIASGDRQAGSPDTFLTQPLVVHAMNGISPAVGTLVTFTVAAGDGQLAETNQGAPPTVQRLTVITDGDGVAQVYLRLPTTNKTVSIKAMSGTAVPVTFQESASDTSMSDNIILTVEGSPQWALAGQPVARPVIVQAKRNGLPVSGLSLTYQVVSGSALVSGGGTTNSDGLAYVSVTPMGLLFNQILVTSEDEGRALITVITDLSQGPNPGGTPSPTPGSGPSPTPTPAPGGLPVPGDPPGKIPAPGGDGDKVEDPAPFLQVVGLSALPHPIEHDPNDTDISDYYDPTRVDLQWTNYSVGADHVEVQSRSSASPEWADIARLSGSATHYTVSGALGNRHYYYRVIACRGDEQSEPADTDYKFPAVRAFDSATVSAGGDKGGALHDNDPNSTTYYKQASSASESHRVTITPEIDDSNHSGGLKFSIETNYTGAPTAPLNYFNEFTTDELIKDVNEALPGYGGWSKNFEGFGWDGISWDRWGDWNIGFLSLPIPGDSPLYYKLGSGTVTPVLAVRNLSSDGVSYSVQKGKYRFRFYPSVPEKITWCEMYVPFKKQGPNNVPDNANITIYKNQSTTSGGSSEEFEIDPTTIGKNGEYLIAPGTELTIGGGADQTERRAGISIGAAGGSFSFTNTLSTNFSTIDWNNSTNASYTISWTNNDKFKVYGHDRWGQEFEIQSGRSFSIDAPYDLGNAFSMSQWASIGFWTEGEGSLDSLDALGRSFQIVPIDGVAPNATTTLTVSAAVNGNTINSTTAKFIVAPPPFVGNLTIPIDEASGALYRKIGLDGRPMPDAKPQQAEENDQEPEETFVDALTLGLRHSTTDSYNKIPGSDFVLSARRDYQSEVWNVKSGFRPPEDPAKPFGACWHTNLVPHIETIKAIYRLNDEPDKVMVTDESGAIHTFIIAYKKIPGPAGGDPVEVPMFFPMPAGKNEQTPNLETLEYRNDARPATYIFKRKYGSTLTFEDRGPRERWLPSDRLNEFSMPGNYYHYYRIRQAVDRLEYTINYSYDNNTNLIPKVISVKDHPDMRISIEQNSAGYITRIWDAKGYETDFGYVTRSYPADTVYVGPIVQLSTVTHPDGSVTTYDYVITKEESLEPLPPKTPKNVSWHCDLASITDPNHHSYAFDYGGPDVFDQSRLDYKSDAFYTGYYTQTGLPRNVQKITLPNNAVTQFINGSKIWITGDEISGYQFQGNRTNSVVDAGGTGYTYSFTNAVVIPLPEIKKYGYTSLTNFRIPKIVAYQKLSISGIGAYEFDLNAAMALKKVTDSNNNVTAYAHADGWTPPPDYALLLGSVDAYHYYPDPTSQTNALSGTKHFTYTMPARIMSSVTDEAGRTTSYVVDAKGRRTKETIGSQVTAFAYDNSTFPGFVTSKSVVKQAGDASPTSTLTTTFVPDADGRVAQEIVAPGTLNLVTSHTYDANGNLKSTTDPRHNTTNFSYDACNRLVGVSYPDGGTKLLVYDARGNKIKEYDENGRLTSFDYDEMNRVITQTREASPAGNIVTSFTYNNVGSKLSQTDPRGNTSNFTYDGLQRLMTATDNDNNTTTYQYGTNCGGRIFESSGYKPTHISAPRSVETDITYDALYRPTLTTVTSPNTATVSTSVKYDAVGNPLVTTDSLNRQTSTTYDALNRPLTTTYADHTSVQNVYSSTGLKWKVVDELGRATTTDYDEAGRPTFTRQPQVDDGHGNMVSPTTQVIYDPAGNMLTKINPLGVRWDFAYDARNRKIKELQPAVFDVDSNQSKRPTILSFYDGVGNLTATIDARGNTTNTTYDAANRATDVLLPTVPQYGGSPAQPHIHTVYDGNGNVLTVTDANNHTTTNTYDKLNHLLTSTDAQQITVTNEYDEAGNRTKIIDGLHQATRFTYDGLNRNTSIHGAGGNITFKYDAINKTQRTDGLNQVTSYTYDPRNRLKTVIYASGGDANPNRTHTYDLAGNLLNVIEAGKGGAANVAYTCDALNRVLTETSGGFTHHYKYDLAGNRIDTVYGGTNREIVSTYDGLNRLATMTQDDNTTTYRYDLSGNVRKKELPADTVEMTYDALGRVDSILDHAHGKDVSLITNHYDLGGNVRQIEEQYSEGDLANRTVTNTYDADNQLTQELVHLDAPGSTNVTTAYTYDAANNRLTRVVTSGLDVATTTYVSNGLNQLTSFTSPTGQGSFTYDANGNRKTRNSGGNHDTLLYDFENRLVELDRAVTGSPVPDTYRYTYDYRTRRVLREEPGVTSQLATLSVFSGGLSCFEREHNATTVEYIRGSDYGGGIGGILYSLRADVPSYAHYNSRGDVVARTNNVGAFTYQAQYDAFGTRTQEHGSTLDRQKMNTKEEDPAGLVDQGFRYYDLETDTWLTRDPAGFVDGPNLYAYVKQNPWTHFDPEGLYSWTQLGVDTKAATGPYLDAVTNLGWGIPLTLSRGADYAHHILGGGSLMQTPQMSETSEAAARQMNPLARAGWYDARQPINQLAQAVTTVGLPLGVSKFVAPEAEVVSTSASITQKTSEKMVELVHGSTLNRVKSIAANGPDAAFVEPKGMLSSQQGFSTVLPGVSLEDPVSYAVGKASIKDFANEGGPALLRMEMPESLFKLGDDLAGNEIRFDKAASDTLRQNWDKVKTTVVPLVKETKDEPKSN